MISLYVVPGSFARQRSMEDFVVQYNFFLVDDVIYPFFQIEWMVLGIRYYVKLIIMLLIVYLDNLRYCFELYFNIFSLLLLMITNISYNTI